MILKSPELIIPEDNPYSNDVFRRNGYGESLYNLYKNLEDNIVMCLDAPWGEGKTSFINMWISDLRNKGINCIYYDAYSNDYCDDPFISFTSEIISLSEKHFTEISSIQKNTYEFKDKAIHIAKTILLSGAKIGIKALTANLINLSDIDTLKDIKDAFNDETDQLFSKYIEKKISSYNDEKKSINNFKELLSKLGGEIRNKQNFPLLIIIDELDRCRPDFSLLHLGKHLQHILLVQ